MHVDLLADGAGLACGVCEYLLDLKHERPKVLFATHFHGKQASLEGPQHRLNRTEIFELDFLEPRPSLTFGHMEVLIDEDADDVEDQVTYLYK